MTNQNASKIIYNLPYNEVYRNVMNVIKDAKRVDISKAEDIEKCKWIAAMQDVFFDVPMHTAVRILNLNNIQYESKSFISEHKEEMKVQRYKKRAISEYEFVYDLILDIAFEADDFEVSVNITTEMIEKCKWILIICHVLSDVYLDVIEPAFREMNFHFDWQVFAEEYDLI